MGQWLEVSLRVIDGEAAEAAAEVLQRYGYQGVVIEHEGIPPDKLDEDELPPPKSLMVRAYIPDDDRASETRKQLEDALKYMNMMYPMPTPEYRQIDEEDWAEAWKAYYYPVRIGRRMFIRPAWLNVPMVEGDLEIALDPGMAFGTGSHPTTQLCLQALEEHVKPGMQVLDLGCGSGILSIGAARLGAGSVLALDIDPLAVESATKNVVLNGVMDKVTVQQGSLDSVITSARRFDILVANILAQVIIDMCDQHLAEAIRPGGLGIFSGLNEERIEEVESALRRVGLEPQRRRQEGDWVAIEARRVQGEGHP